MINFASWYYRELLGPNHLIEAPDFYQIEFLDGKLFFESNVKLLQQWRPNWLVTSSFYKDCDGSGTDKFKNVAVYKAISEALERLAFYELIDTQEKKFSFDLNPTTTGLAAYPHYSSSLSRVYARNEAIERWAIHEFNKNNLPLRKHSSPIKNLEYYEIIVPFNDVKVTLLCCKYKHFYCYGFSGSNNLANSFKKSLIELDRNIRVLKKANNEIDSSLFSAVDKTLKFYSTNEGYLTFKELISRAPEFIKNQDPRILCDKPLNGHWDKYTKIWRFLLENSYFNCAEDHKFFMF